MSDLFHRMGGSDVVLMREGVFSGMGWFSESTSEKGKFPTFKRGTVAASHPQHQPKDRLLELRRDLSADQRQKNAPPGQSQMGRFGEVRQVTRGHQTRAAGWISIRSDGF